MEMTKEEIVRNCAKPSQEGKKTVQKRTEPVGERNYPAQTPETRLRAEFGAFGLSGEAVAAFGNPRAGNRAGACRHPGNGERGRNCACRPCRKRR